jgi:hypothetical protein
MGLLDEAIREHLELKRRSGADPTAVAREEREALEPGFADDQVLPDGDMDHRLDVVASPPLAEAEALEPIEAHQSPDVGLVYFSSVGQDTAELDMRSVLGEDFHAHEPSPAFGAIREGAQAAYAGQAPMEESLDWDAEGDPDRESSPEEIPGQERLSFE